MKTYEDGESFWNALIPEDLQEVFKVERIKEKGSELEVRVVEDVRNIPQILVKLSVMEKKDVVQNGYRKRVEVVTFPFRDKLVYLHFYRRRWKLKGERASYHNEYNLHPAGMKCTREFGNFLKGLSGQKRRKFFTTFSKIRHVREKDFSLVS